MGGLKKLQSKRLFHIFPFVDSVSDNRLWFKNNVVTCLSKTIKPYQGTETLPVCLSVSVNRDKSRFELKHAVTTVKLLKTELIIFYSSEFTYKDVKNNNNITLGHMCLNKRKCPYRMRKKHLFDNDDAFLRLLVGDDVKYVVPSNDAIFHLSIASHVWVVGFDSPNGPAHLGGLGCGYTKGI